MKLVRLAYLDTNAVFEREVIRVEIQTIVSFVLEEVERFPVSALSKLPSSVGPLVALNCVSNSPSLLCSAPMWLYIREAMSVSI